MFQIATVNSTAIKTIGYNPESRILRITFRRGDTYDYSPVPQSIFLKLIESESVGKLYLTTIKKHYPCKRLSPEESQHYLLQIEKHCKPQIISIP